MTTEITQMHVVNVFHPIKRDSLTKEERGKALATGQDGLGVNVCGQKNAERRLKKARIDLADGRDKIDVHHGHLGCSKRERWGVL